MNSNNNNNNNNIDNKKLVVEGNEASISTQIKLQKALSRVKSLEKTVEFLQDEHKNALKGLHEEISRLQNVCSG